MSTYPPNRLDRQGSANSAIPLSPMTPSGRASPEYDPERAGPHGTTRSGMTHTLKGSARSSSWDLLAGIRKIEHSYEEFDSRNASQPHLAYADGDLPDSKLVKFYNYLLNVSIITRWFLFIIPILAILWIPGILSFTKFPNAKIWGVGLLWWSIWLSVVWGGWWVSLAFARTIPVILRGTLGVVAVGLRRYIDWTTVLHRYVALFVWTLTVWVTWNPLIDNHQDGNTSTKSKNAVDLAAKLFFAFFLCAALLLFEKFSIQWIAGKFHERSYAERIADQKFAVRSLVTLYQHSSDIPGRTDTLHESAHVKNGSVNPKRFFKKLRQGVRMAATTTTTAFGNVASEIAGSSVLQPNSPQSVVKTALESANKSRLLARRLYYSFARPHAEYLLVTDIARFFPSMEEADAVFALFDRDSNGDASRDEVEAALLEFHREQLSIENSMRDLDSAVGRLDNILMSVYAIVAILIVAIALEAQLATVVTGAGTLILGLSWLIGGSLQEVLTSIIFLFVKHPFDVGDKVVITKETYTVKEIRLLTTIFLDSNNTSVQAPNSILNTQFIQNIRRSPQMSETFTFDVAYSTNFEDLEKLRDKMLAFVTAERRDYLPSFDVAVKDFPEQSMMTLTADIKYKSNSQLGAIKAKRRNKWICQLKSALAECKIYGPKGNPDAPAAITKYTQVPYDEVKAKERAEAHAATAMPSAPASTWQLVDQNPASVGMSSGDVFDEADQLYMTSPRRGLPEDPNNQVRFRQTAGQAPAMPAPGPNMPAPGPTGLPRTAASAPTLMPAASVAGPSSPDTIETTPRR